MQSMKPVTLIDLTRQERLEIEMRRKGLTFKRLGELAGMTGVNAAKHLKSSTIPPRHHAVWSTVLPEDLLPAPVHQKPGPKPKATNSPSDQSEPAPSENCLGFLPRVDRRAGRPGRRAEDIARQTVAG